jgi:hypothetical protein
MSGWNLIDCAREVPRAQSPRLCFEADLYNIHAINGMSEVPLSIMSWDIEVSTESGKFDDDGHNPNNRIVCICYTIADATGMGKSRKQVCLISN